MGGKEMNIVNPQPSGAKAGTGGFTVDISQIISNFTGAETDDNKIGRASCRERV